MPLQWASLLLDLLTYGVPIDFAWIHFGNLIVQRIFALAKFRGTVLGFLSSKATECILFLNIFYDSRKRSFFAFGAFRYVPAWPLFKYLTSDISIYHSEHQILEHNFLRGVSYNYSNGPFIPNYTKRFEYNQLYFSTALSCFKFGC